jgi:hypothetical protein
VAGHQPGPGLAGHHPLARQHDGAQRAHRRRAVWQRTPATARRPAPAGRHQPAADRLRGAVAGAPGAQPLPLSPVRRRRRLAGRRQQHARVLHQPRTGQLPVRGGSRQRRRHLEHCTGQPQLPHRPTFMQTVWFKLLCAPRCLRCW